MFNLSGETAQIVGILHDVVEDSEVSFADLQAMGFSEEVIEALVRVTRREDETYEEFIIRGEQNPISKQVKLADLADNMDIKRLKTFTDKDKARLDRYHQAWLRLTGGR